MLHPVRFTRIAACANGPSGRAAPRDFKAVLDLVRQPSWSHDKWVAYCIRLYEEYQAIPRGELTVDFIQHGCPETAVAEALLFWDKPPPAVSLPPLKRQQHSPERVPVQLTPRVSRSPIRRQVRSRSPILRHKTENTYMQERVQQILGRTTSKAAPSRPPSGIVYEYFL